MKKLSLVFYTHLMRIAYFPDFQQLQYTSILFILQKLKFHFSSVEHLDDSTGNPTIMLKIAANRVKQHDTQKNQTKSTPSTIEKLYTSLPTPFSTTKEYSP